MNSEFKKQAPIAQDVTSARDGTVAKLICALGAAIYSGHSDGFDQEVKRGLAPSSPSRRQGKFFAALLPLK